MNPPNFDQKESAVTNLSTRLFTVSLYCTDLLEAELEGKFLKGKNTYQEEWIKVLFEFMFFFMHLVQRSALQQLGEEKRNKLVDALFPVMINEAAELVLRDLPEEKRLQYKKEAREHFNRSELNYSKCREFFLDRKDDVGTVNKIAFGGSLKSKALINQLVDNLSEDLTGKINTDSFQLLKIRGLVVEILKKENFHDLVLKTSSEIR